MITSGRNIKTLRDYSGIFLFILVLAFSLLTGCEDDETPTNGGGNGTPGANEVFMQSDTFVPASRTVTVGTTITWINKENDTHTVTSGTEGSPSGMFESGDLGLNGEFQFTFTTAGTFTYYCRHHSGMTGTIIVQ